jgi:arginase
MDLSTKIVIQGFPFDERSSFLRGPAKAPPLIRRHYRSDANNFFAENGVDTSAVDLVDLGDFVVGDLMEIAPISSANAANASLITLGGDHSITYPVLKGLREHFAKIDILHFDAHPDIYDELYGDRLSHACPFARIMEEGLADRLVQVGIRTATKHQREQIARFGVECHEMKDFADFEMPVFENPLYISIDLDALDPAFAPGVSHHEPGGLSTRELLDILYSLDTEIIGADIVEYNPERDVGDITGALAGKLLRELIGKMA